jgi:translation initiation factor 3 subunit D
LTVSETSTDPPQDDEKHINSPNNLALEATFINHNLSQQVLRMVIQIITGERKIKLTIN